MRAKTLIRFMDLKENTIREVGDVFELTKVRFAEISALSPKTLIVEIEMEKKLKKPKTKAGD